MFFTDYILKYIVDQTNLYQQQCATKHDFTHLEWYLLTITELKTWLGLLLSMGMLQKIGRLSDYWSQEPVLATPIFGLAMPSRRFLQIMRFLHFVNNEDLSIDTTFKTYKIQYLIDYLCKRFRAVYVPKCELSIDETMLKAKGRFQYKQYIKIKPIKWGIKLFTVAESTTGYVLNVLPYTGKRCVTNYGKTTQTVLDVAKDFLMKGHKFFLDNYYMSLELMKVLAQMNTLCCWTVNSSRVGLSRHEKELC